MKILTIAVPAYNAEKTIRECLDSMVKTVETGNDIKNTGTEVKDEDGGLMPDSRLEIIVVNDGSKDSTAEIAKEYIGKYPDTVKLIDKKNGGHGSGINSAIKEAQGKFFKVIDSDDWIVSENLSGILDKLEKTDAEAVVTAYKSVNEVSGKVQVFETEGEYSGKMISMKEFSEFFQTKPACYQFHGLMYNTEFYRNLNIKMMEKVSYEDQQYAVMPFAKADKILILPEYFYMYRLGSEGQTVNIANQTKKAGDMVKVFKAMSEFHLKCKAEDKNWSAERENFFTKRLSIAALSYYAVVLVKNKDKAAGKASADEFSQYLMENEPEVYEHALKRLKSLQMAQKLPGVMTAYNKLSDSDRYMRFKKRWNK